MVVREDDRRCILRQCDLDDLTRVDAGLRDGAAEELDVFDQPVLRIQQQSYKELMLQLAELGPQEVADHARCGHRGTATYSPADNLACRLEDLIGARALVLARG